jgi:hypothetical protein
MGAINSSDRIAKTWYSLRTSFDSGIYVCMHIYIYTLHIGDNNDDDDNNNNIFWTSRKILMAHCI